MINGRIMINIDSILDNQAPKLRRRPLIKKFASFILKRLLHADRINNALETYGNKQGWDFLDDILENVLQISYTMNQREFENIPEHGRLIIVANHPFGSFDGLLLLQMVSKIRKDVKVVTNELLYLLDPLRPLFLPVDNMRGNVTQDQLDNIEAWLKKDGVVIFFPAGEVSRTSPSGVRDTKWRPGFLKFAYQTQSPVLPIFVAGKNSKIFYMTSMVSKPLSTLLLVNEMFKNVNCVVPLKIGEMVPFDEILKLELSHWDKAQLFRKHVYRLAKSKPPVFKTTKAIAHPEKRRDLNKALDQHEYLGDFAKTKRIFLVNYEPDSPIMRELGRCREIAFREVGEGTGHRRDLDQYDQYYQHLILWDKENLDIVGAYRMGRAGHILKTQPDQESPLYCQTLFQFDKSFYSKLEVGVELGRSFVLPKYWGRRSLDYLWFGLGAYIQKYPELEYFFGPVSISQALSKPARDILVYFYHNYFGDAHSPVHARTPYVYDSENIEECQHLFELNNYTADFKVLKTRLEHLGFNVPTLYRQYSELCEAGGVKFLDFGIDPNFGYCIDGFLALEISKIREQKRKRYLDVWKPEKIQAEAV